MFGVVIWAACLTRSFGLAREIPLRSPLDVRPPARALICELEEPFPGPYRRLTFHVAHSAPSHRLHCFRSRAVTSRNLMDRVVNSPRGPEPGAQTLFRGSRSVARNACHCIAPPNEPFGSSWMDSRTRLRPRIRVSRTPFTILASNPVDASTSTGFENG